MADNEEFSRFRRKARLGLAGMCLGGVLFFGGFLKCDDVIVREQAYINAHVYSDVDYKRDWKDGIKLMYLGGILALSSTGLHISNSDRMREYMNLVAK